jgi:hypothetical protein
MQVAAPTTMAIENVMMMIHLGMVAKIEIVTVVCRVETMNLDVQVNTIITISQTEVGHNE